MIASASADSIPLWNATTFKCTRVMSDLGKRWVEMVAWSPCSKFLYSAMRILDPSSTQDGSAQARVYRVDGQQ